MNVNQKHWQEIQHYKALSLSFSEMADEDEAELNDEELIEIEEEADLIQAERIVVDAEHRDNNWKKLKQDQKNIDDMAELMLAMNLNDPEPQQAAKNQRHGQSHADQEEWQVRDFVH